MLNHFFKKEQRYGARLRWGLWGLILALILTNISVQLGMVSAVTSLGFTVVALGLVVALARKHQTHKHTLETRLSALLQHIDLDWSSLGALPLTDEQRESVHQAFSVQFSSSGHTNEAYMRTRGKDAKGPVFDSVQLSIDPNLQRVDPSLHEEDYVGLEDDLRPSEALLGEADQRYGEEAQRRWAIAEKQDMDNIEAGVDRLGDLVASGWFEKNAEDGAMAALLEEQDPQ